MWRPRQLLTLVTVVVLGCTRPRTTDRAVDGAALFERRCATCHGISGAGDGPAAQGLSPPPRAFDDARWQDAVTDAHISAVIERGGPANGLSPVMPPHPDLSDEELRRLVAHIRSLRGAER